MIHHDERNLRLQCDSIILIYNVASLLVDIQCTFVFLDHLLRFIFGREDKRIAVVVSLSDIFRQIFLAVIFSGTVCTVNCQSILEPVFSERIVVAVCHFFIAYALDRLVLRGFDRKASAVEKIVCLSLGVSFFIHKILYHVFDQRVGKVRIRRCVFCNSRRLENAVVYRICNGFVVFRLADISLIQHISQDGFPALCIVIGIGHGIISGRILRDRGDDCTFRQCQIRRVFIEIALCRSLHAETSLPQIDRIHISLKDFFLAHFFFKLESQILLLKFTFYPFETALIDKIRKDIVFDKLLGQCAGAFREIKSVGDAHDTGAYDTLKVNSVVFVETFILYSHKCVWEILGICRDLLVRLIYTVGIRITKSLKHISALIGNIGRITLREYVFCRDGGSIVDDMFGKDYGSDDTYDSQKEYTDYKGFKESYAYAFLFHSFFGRKTFLSSGKVSFPVIHE